MARFHVLLIGKGGREYAFLRKLLFSPEVFVTVAPGLTGMLGLLDEDARSRVKLETKIKETDIKSINKLAQEIKPDLTVIGPEDPTALGLADELWNLGFKVFGFGKKYAQLETSKSFCKEIYHAHGLPTAKAIVIRNKKEASRELAKLRQKGQPIVLKSDGLALGKGVVIVSVDHPDYWGENKKKISEMMDLSAPLGFVAKKVLLEHRYPIMNEWSAMHIVGPKRFWVPLMPTRDHKLFNGLNTGGMGIIAPAPEFTMADMESRRRIPLILQQSLQEENLMPFCGIIYEGLNRMLNTDYLVEINMRGGDPETQGQFEFIQGLPFHELLLAAVEGKANVLKKIVISQNKALVGVVMASKGYPEYYQKGKEIMIPEILETLGMIFPSGLAWEDGKFYTVGGRVLMAIGVADNIKEARSHAYIIVNSISHQENLVFREDIGKI
ncbi:hypothetical protein JW977_01125 [Candidatus Falkowbacteria bacterium]|nr:hypothetical protein [Candidatus Falkowbacteria bacterium]